MNNRYSYHIQPENGWGNDPNGLIYFKGRYHYFYQNNPLATNNSRIYWGHVSSTDLIHWQREEMALAPETEYDQDGCFSGSAIVVDGKLYLMYTGHKNLPENYSETQCLAVSSDGITFEKIDEPIISTPPANNTHRFRDPKVWRNGDRFCALIGGENVEGFGQVHLYQSIAIAGPWQFVKTIAKAQLDEGTMWECPDYFTLDNQGMLLISPKGLGTADKGGFNSLYAINKSPNVQEADFSDFKILDKGTDFYAATTFFDPIKQRRLMVAWFGLPGEQEKEVGYHQVGALTMTRELKIEGDQLLTPPIEEYEELRQTEVTFSDEMKLSGSSELLFTPQEYFELKLKGDQGGYIVSYQNHQLQLTICDKLRNRIKTIAISEIKELRLFIDQGLTELYINEGEKVFTNKCELGNNLFVQAENILEGKAYLLAPIFS